MLKAKRLSDGRVFPVWKYLNATDERISVWCRGWSGHHIVGEDCELFLEEVKI